ncbi:MAG: hypothetical protein AB8E82_16775 [Aureispira sp.]
MANNIIDIINNIDSLEELNKQLLAGLKKAKANNNQSFIQKILTRYKRVYTRLELLRASAEQQATLANFIKLPN